MDSIFDRHVEFDSAGDFEDFLRRVPSKWVVYLLVDGEGKPIQLLCVKNLRASLKRRLGGEEMIGPSRRVNYRDVVRGVYWRRVDSAFEADWIYLEIGREVFPETYRKMVGLRPAWFVHVDAEAKFPRYTKVTEIGGKRGKIIGPMESKQDAGRLIELAEDAFDLCRYYNILTAAPKGKACAYKEMGKCPAPCDGSISMEQYRGMIGWSAEVIVKPGEFIEEQTRRMEMAARELRFETAGKIKLHIEQVSQWGKGPFRYVGRLEDFVFLSLQRGPWQGTGKVFLVTPGAIEELAGLIGEPEGVLELARGRVVENAGRKVDEAGVERMGVVAHHLFWPKEGEGMFLRLRDVDENVLGKAYRELKKQKEEVEVDEEGVVKELTGEKRGLSAEE